MNATPASKEDRRARILLPDDAMVIVDRILDMTCESAVECVE